MNNFNQFINEITAIENKSLLEDFLIGITTPKERLKFVQRLQIVYMLMQGKPHHVIAKELGVGVATVTRGSRELASGRFKALRSKSYA